MRLRLDKPFALPPRSLQHSFRPCHCQAPRTLLPFIQPESIAETSRPFTLGRLP